MGLLRLLAAGADAREFALTAPRGTQGREARELRGVQAGDQARIRGEGVGVPRLRLPRRDEGRRALRGRRVPAGVVRPTTTLRRPPCVIY